MIILEQIMEIKILHKHAKSLRSIAREVGVSVNTVRKYLKYDGRPKYKVIWPDNDEAGFKAAEVIKNKLNKANDHIGFVSVIDPTYLKFDGSAYKDLLPEKWDLADRLPEGMIITNVKEAIEGVRAAHLDLNQIPECHSEH